MRVRHPGLEATGHYFLVSRREENPERLPLIRPVPPQKPAADPRHARGRAAEQAAMNAAKGAGYSFVTQNYRCRRGEIDLVLTDAGVLVFVEVRYRSNAAFGDGAASITVAKRRRIISAATHFLSTFYRITQPPCRFDVALNGMAEQGPTISK